MTGRQVLGSVVAIVLATAVLPPAAAWAVNQRRVARAEREVVALAERLNARGSDLAPAGSTATVLCGSGQMPAAVAEETRVWTFAPPVSPDPWGNCYLIHPTRADPSQPAVRIISAGPNGTIETPLNGAAQRGGDDIAQFF